MTTVFCPTCDMRLDLSEYSPGHVGINVFRCNSCACSMVKHKAEIPPGYTGKKPIEDYFPPCECGGKFTREARQRCSKCNTILDIARLIPVADSDITKRDSGEYFIHGYSRELRWKLNY